MKKTTEQKNGIESNMAATITAAPLQESAGSSVPVELVGSNHFAFGLQLTDEDVQAQAEIMRLLNDDATFNAVWSRIRKTLVAQGLTLELRARRRQTRERRETEKVEKIRRDNVNAAHAAFKNADTGDINNAINFYGVHPLLWTVLPIHYVDSAIDGTGWLPVGAVVAGIRSRLNGVASTLSEHFKLSENQNDRLAVDIAQSKIVILTGGASDFAKLSAKYPLPPTLSWIADGKEYRAYKRFANCYTSPIYASITLMHECFAPLPPSAGTEWVVSPKQFADSMGDNQTGLPELPQEFTVTSRLEGYAKQSAIHSCGS